jgi:iron complex transport system substrate-binding protein
MSKHRIISLIASSTEIVCALGFEDQLVGRSHECDFPPLVKRLPVCTEPKIDIHGKSYEIDQRVKAVLQEGLSVYRVFADKLKELKPDIIITQIQCEVCAVSEKDVMQAVCELVDSRPQIVSLNPNSLSDFWEDIRRVAGALGALERGEELIASLKGRMKGVEEKVKTSLSPSPQPSPSRGEGAQFPSPQGRGVRGEGSRPTVAFIEWIDPLMSCGNWMPELIEMAGGINLFGEAGKHSPWMKWEELKEKDPDVIVVSPCGYDIPKTREEMPPLTSKPDWPKLKAVKNKKVFVADGNQYFNRPGPRLVETLEMLAEMFHPSLFHFRHEGKGWERL